MQSHSGSAAIILEKYMLAFFLGEGQLVIMGCVFERKKYLHLFSSRLQQGNAILGGLHMIFEQSEAGAGRWHRGR